MDVPLASNILGTLGAVFWSIQLLPQIWLNYRRHDATGLQPTMMMFWAWAGVPLGVYNVVSSFSIALQIQPQILATLSLVTWTQCYYYHPTSPWSAMKALAIGSTLAAVMGAIEVGLVFALRRGLERGVHWPVTLMAVLAALFLALGVGRHYVDIWVHRTVRGISFWFVGLDAMGDLTSMISVLFLPKLDVLGLVIYGTELVLWLGVFAAGGYYLFVPWVRQKLRTRRSLESEMVATGTSTGIAMHHVESSSSVFRTPSMVEQEVRARTISLLAV
nr:hypothetical protein B0A51_12126 [Rachicladosporium sp. CCFEE 5018]